MQSCNLATQNYKMLSARVRHKSKHLDAHHSYFSKKQLLTETVGYRGYRFKDQNAVAVNAAKLDMMLTKE